jgi:hypothetical protein
MEVATTKQYFEFILFYFIIILSLTFSQNWLISLVLDLPVKLLDKIEKEKPSSPT